MTGLRGPPEEGEAMRPGDERQGDVTLGLSEYTSRYCRLKLVEAAASGIERELNEKHDRRMSQLDSRVGAASVLAGILGVSPRTVQRWLSGGVQSCNVNAEKLIQASLEHAPEETKRLLEAADAIHSLYAPRATQSELRRSEPQGWHIFVVIYPKEPPK